MWNALMNKLFAADDDSLQLQIDRLCNMKTRKRQTSAAAAAKNIRRLIHLRAQCKASRVGDGDSGSLRSFLDAVYLTRTLND